MICKNHLLYEQILIETKSVMFKHFAMQDDLTHITHSTTIILQIISPSKWGFSSYTIKKILNKSQNQIHISTHITGIICTFGGQISTTKAKIIATHRYFILNQLVKKSILPNWFNHGGMISVLFKKFYRQKLGVLIFFTTILKHRYKNYIFAILFTFSSISQFLEFHPRNSIIISHLAITAFPS